MKVVSHPGKSFVCLSKPCGIIIINKNPCLGARLKPILIRNRIRQAAEFTKINLWHAAAHFPFSMRIQNVLRFLSAPSPPFPLPIIFNPLNKCHVTGPLVRVRYQRGNGKWARVFDFLARTMGLPCQGRFARICLEQRLRLGHAIGEFPSFPTFPALRSLHAELSCSPWWKGTNSLMAFAANH